MWDKIASLFRSLAGKALSSLTSGTLGFALMFLAWVLVVWTLNITKDQLEAEKIAHAATAKERDQWMAAAEAYRKEAIAQAENTKMCLDREAKASQEAQARAAIVKNAKPCERTAQEKNKVVDDETRHNAVLRLNRPL